MSSKPSLRQRANMPDTPNYILRQQALEAAYEPLTVEFVCVVCESAFTDEKAVLECYFKHGYTVRDL